MAVKSSYAVFEVLREISCARRALGAADIATILKLPLTSASRALNTLEAAGYVQRQNGAARFVVGKSGQRLAYAFMAQFPIRDLALPYLHQLTLLSGHSSSLFIRLGWYAVRIALIAGTSSIVNVAPIGETRSLSTGAPSLAMLAQLDDDEFARALERSSPHERTSLREQCERIRVQGYAYSVSMLESGGHDLAFPIADRTRSVLASVALDGLLMDLSNIQDQIDQARQVISVLQDIVMRGSAALVPHYEHVNPDDIDLG